jgi:hypothetical protein
VLGRFNTVVSFFLGRKEHGFRETIPAAVSLKSAVSDMKLVWEILTHGGAVTEVSGDMSFTLVREDGGPAAIASMSREPGGGHEIAHKHRADVPAARS